MYVYVCVRMCVCMYVYSNLPMILTSHNVRYWPAAALTVTTVPSVPTGHLTLYAAC